MYRFISAHLRSICSDIIRSPLFLISFCGLWAGSGPALSANEAFRIVSDGKAHFSYYLAGQRTRGFIPIESAGLMLDLDAPQGAEIIVNFNVARARAGNVLATSALREEKVLDIKSFPNARFVSRQIMRLNGGVRVTGDFTLRGETREMDLNISLLRDGRADDEPSILQVVGQFDRREYGADGYPGLVDPMIELDFQLEIIPLR